MLLFPLDKLDTLSPPSLPLVLTQLVVASMRTQIAKPPPGAPPDSEAVCPFMPEAINFGLIRAGWHDADSMGEIVEPMLALQAEFLARPPHAPEPKHVFKTDVIIFPRQIFMDPADQWNAFVDLRIALSVESFLKAGLMIGFFQLPQKVKDGPSFSIPLLIIRYLVKRDLNFILKCNDPEEAGIFAEVYNRLFG